MNRRKRDRHAFLILCGVAAVAVLLAACQPAQPEVIEVTREVEREVEVTREIEQEVVVTPTAEPESEGPVTLVMWSFLDQEYPNLYPFYREKLAGFQEMYPNVDVEFVPIPYEGSDAKYLAAFAGRENAPDMWVGKVAYFAGGLKVADPAPPDVQEAWSESVIERIQPFFKWEDDFYGYPIEADLGMMLYYNTDMFRNAGLDPEDPPETMDELLEYAQAITAGTGNPGFAVRYLGNPRGMADKWLPFLHAWCGRLYAEDGSTSDGYLNSPEAIESLQFYGDLVNEHEVASLTVGTPMDAFSRGQVGMFFREAWTVGVLRDTAPDLNYAVSPLPEEDCYPGVSHLFGQSIMVNKFSPNKDITWEWMRYMTMDHEIDMEAAEINGTLPVHIENWDTDYVTERPDYEAELHILENPAGPYYDAPFINEIAFRVGQAVESVLYGETTAEEALNAAVPDVDDLLNK